MMHRAVDRLLPCLMRRPGIVCLMAIAAELGLVCSGLLRAGHETPAALLLFAGETPAVCWFYLVVAPYPGRVEAPFGWVWQRAELAAHTGIGDAFRSMRHKRMAWLAIVLLPLVVIVTRL